MIEKPTRSSRAGLSWRKSGFGEMQKMLQAQAHPTPGMWFVRAGMALSPQNSGPWKGTEQNQPHHPLGREGSRISKTLGFQGILTSMVDMSLPGELIYPCQVSTFSMEGLGHAKGLSNLPKVARVAEKSKNPVGS